MALKIYIKARATPKVVAAFAERREFDKILIYSKQVQSLVLQNSHFQLLDRSCALKCTGSLKPFDFFFQVGYTPDYLFLLQTILRTDPQVIGLRKIYLELRDIWYYLALGFLKFCESLPHGCSCIFLTRELSTLLS
jgi:hypothetical protein